MNRCATAKLLGLALAVNLLATGAPAAAVPGRAGTAGVQGICARSPAFQTARAHIGAWSHHDFFASRRMLATDVHVLASTPDGGLPRTDTVGADKYMAGLKAFASAVVPGSARIIASTCDQNHALIVLAVKATLGPGKPKTLTGARLYEVDANRRINDEQVIFFVTP